jgi:hypothetical protein
MNRRFPSDFLFLQKEQRGSKSEPGPDRFQDTTPAGLRCIRQTLAGVSRMYLPSRDRPSLTLTGLPRRGRPLGVHWLAPWLLASPALRPSLHLVPIPEAHVCRGWIWWPRRLVTPSSSAIAFARTEPIPPCMSTTAGTKSGAKVLLAIGCPLLLLGAVVYFTDGGMRLFTILGDLLVLVGVGLQRQDAREAPSLPPRWPTPPKWSRLS